MMEVMEPPESKKEGNSLMQFMMLKQKQNQPKQVKKGGAGKCKRTIEEVTLENDENINERN